MRPEGFFLALVAVGCHGACPASDTTCSSETDDTVLLSHKAGAALTAGSSNLKANGGSTADMLANLQSLAQKVVSGEEKITNATRLALNSISDEMDKIMQYSAAQHIEDQDELKAAKQAIVDCGTEAQEDLAAVTSLASAMNAKKSTHNDCRVEEKKLLEDKVKACGDFQTFATTLNPPRCMENFPASPSDDLLKCIQDIAKWDADQKEVSYIAQKKTCDDAASALETQRVLCNGDQSTYESSVCTYAHDLTKTCVDQTRCRDKTIAAGALTHANVQRADEARHGEYKSAVSIKCLLKVLFAPETEKTGLLAECNKLDTTPPFTMEYPEEPAPVVCDTGPAQSKPCDADWVKANYEDKKDSWYDFAKHNTYTSETEKVVPQDCVACSAVATTGAPEASPTCAWKVSQGYHLNGDGSRQYTCRNEATVEDAKSFCVAEPTCIGFDWRQHIAGKEGAVCWYHGGSAQLGGNGQGDMIAYKLESRPCREAPTVTATATSGRPITVIPKAAIDQDVFMDRKYKISSLGDFAGMSVVYIKPPNDDKNTAASSIMWTLQVSVPVTVYLDFWGGSPHVAKVSSLWLSDWERTDLTGMTHYEGTRKYNGPVYRRSFPAGSIPIYGNNGKGHGTFTVFVGPSEKDTRFERDSGEQA